MATRQIERIVDRLPDMAELRSEFMRLWPLTVELGPVGTASLLAGEGWEPAGVVAWWLTGAVFASDGGAGCGLDSVRAWERARFLLAYEMKPASERDLQKALPAGKTIRVRRRRQEGA